MAGGNASGGGKGQMWSALPTSPPPPPCAPADAPPASSACLCRKPGAASLCPGRRCPGHLLPGPCAGAHAPERLLQQPSRPPAPHIPKMAHTCVCSRPRVPGDLDGGGGGGQPTGPGFPPAAENEPDQARLRAPHCWLLGAEGQGVYAPTLGSQARPQPHPLCRFSATACQPDFQPEAPQVPKCGFSSGQVPAPRTKVSQR